jgi:hypothetical protein
MPAVEIAIIIPFALLPFLFAYISFNLWNRYTGLGIFFLTLSLTSVIMSFGILVNLADGNRYRELSYFFINLIYAIVVVIAITIATFLLEIIPKIVRFPNILQALRSMFVERKQ